MKVVDLADEFGLTTAEAIDACLWAGVPADSSAAELTDDDAERVRGLIAGWIDAGFVPWRSQGEPHPGALKGSGTRSASSTTAADASASPPGGRDRSTTTLEPPNGRGAARPSAPPRPAPPTGDGTGTATEDPDAARAVEAADDGPIRLSAKEAGDLADVPATPVGPRLPPSRGGPTGWMPGGPDAQPRVSPLAIVALALGISSLVIPFVTAVLGIVLASVAKDRIGRSRGWSKGTKIATAAQIVAGVGIGLWLVLLASQLIFLQNKDKEPDFSDIQVELGTAKYEDVKVGDCVRLPKTGDITDWKLVKCDESHQAEVFATLPVGNAAGLRYPGDAPIQATAKADCRQRLSRYMEDPLEEQSIETGFAYPSAKTWRDEGDRTIWCVAFRKDGTLLGQSIKSPNVVIVTSTTGG